MNLKCMYIARKTRDSWRLSRSNRSEGYYKKKDACKYIYIVAFSDINCFIIVRI